MSNAEAAQQLWDRAAREAQQRLGIRFWEQATVDPFTIEKRAAMERALRVGAGD